MIETLSDYRRFLKKPQLLRLSNNRKTLLNDVFWLILLDFVFIGLLMLIYTSLKKSKVIVNYEEYDIFEHGFAWAMVLGIILAPLFEELIFRWQLRKPKLSVWFVVISAGSLVCSSTSDDYLRFFAIIFFIGLGLSAFVVFEKSNRLNAIRRFRQYYVFLFYYTAIIFGYVHLSNFKGLTLSDPSFIIYISSQIFGGLSMGYIRVKYGLLYSMLMHGCINAILIPIAWLMK